MKIKLENGKPASEEAIDALESTLGYPLSDSFRVFLRKHNGADPESNSFKVGTTNLSGVHEFIPVEQIADERQYLEDLPQKAYPVASDDCGNYIFIDEGKNGAVFFLDHEVLIGITKLAPNFGAFLDLLEPFDTKTPRLKPGEVARVWVNPEFLKKLQEKGGADESSP